MKREKNSVSKYFYVTNERNTKIESYLPQKEVVANLLLSNGGAHLLQIPWQAG